MARGVTVDLIVDPKKAIDGLNKAGGVAGGLTKTLGTLGKLGAGAIAGLGAVAAGFAGASFAALVEVEKLNAQTAAAIKSTGGVAGRSIDQITELAGSLERLTGIEAEAIQEGQNLLLTFTNIKGDAFDGATQAALDLSVAMGTDMSSAATLVGKALNDPIKGVSALSRVGVQLSDDQKELINTLMETGDVAGAQAVILKELEVQFGGSAEAFGNTFAGALEKAKNAVGAIGEGLVAPLLPVATGILSQFSETLLDVEGDLSKAGPAFETLGSSVIGALSEQLPAILQAGSSLVLGIIQGIVAQLPSLVQSAIPLVMSLVTSILAMLPALLTTGVQVLVALIQGIAAALPQLIPAAIAAILGLVMALVENLPLIIDAGLQLIVGLATGIIGALPTLIEQIPVIITGIITALLAAIPMLITAGIDLFLSLIGNLPAIITGIIKAVPQIITGIFNAITDPKMLAKLAKAGGELIKGLWNGIKDLGAWLWGKISGFFGGVVDNIKSFFGIASPSKLFAGFGRFMVQGLEKGLSGPNRLSAVMGDLSSQVSDGFTGSLAATARATVSTSAEWSGRGQTINVNLSGLVGGVEAGREVARVLQSYKAAGGRVAF